MSWQPSSRPPLPPRPLSTYPSADFERQQQSNEGRSSRQSIGSPPSVDYNFQPMRYTSSTPPPQFQSQHQTYQQQPQHTQYQPDRPPQAGYTWNPRSVSDSNTNRASIVRVSSCSFSVLKLTRLVILSCSCIVAPPAAIPITYTGIIPANQLPITPTIRNRYQPQLPHFRFGSGPTNSQTIFT